MRSIQQRSKKQRGYRGKVLGAVLTLSLLPLTGSYSASASSSLPEQSRVISQHGHGNPLRIAISPNGAIAYVVNATSHSISVIDVASDTRIGQVANYRGRYPSDVAFSPDGAIAYVTNSASHSVSVVYVATHTVLHEVHNYQGKSPRRVDFSPYGDVAYVTNPESNSVSVIDPVTHTQISTVHRYRGSNPQSVRFAPDGSIAYVTNAGRGDFNPSISVIDAGSNIQYGYTRYTGAMPDDVAFSPTSTIAYVTDSHPDKDISVLYGQNEIKTINRPDLRFNTSETAFSSDGKYAYVTNRKYDSVSVIDTATHNPIGFVAKYSGKSPVGIAVTPNGEKAYVANSGSSSISVVKLR
ncbi:YncE family protein [Lysinibacter sp. HNR]|uniref:YncE family protein n=1 Tax=Lysinibacter sp. HNR TaxID=3031408 RepID=UPI002435DAA4|nr:YncE family protein [Lysinibacter sp. HNR]WGD36953.1 YncE family protein [Lysinibacter sp. HNR]